MTSPRAASGRNFGGTSSALVGAAVLAAGALFLCSCTPTPTLADAAATSTPASGTASESAPRATFASGDVGSIGLRRPEGESAGQTAASSSVTADESAAAATSKPNPKGAAPTVTPGPAASIKATQTSPLTVAAPASKSAVAEHLGPNVTLTEPEKGSVSYLRLHDGMRMGTAGERTARPALSLIKLYLAAYVLEKGSVEERFAAIDMLTDSSDVIADELFEKYPESIDAIAKEYHLESTRSGDRWGFSVTSTYDVVEFLSQLNALDPTHPIFVAMAQYQPVAADGYKQDYGTATLQNVLGSKWGWSDDRTLHSSVSFGKNFIVAAAINGSADELTGFVKKTITPDNLGKATAQHLEKGGVFVLTTEAPKPEPKKEEPKKAEPKKAEPSKPKETVKTSTTVKDKPSPSSAKTQ